MMKLKLLAIEEMLNYEIARCNDTDFYYDLNRDKLKEQLNLILNKNYTKVKFQRNGEKYGKNI